MRPQLAEGKVTTQDGEALGTERIRQRCEKQRAAVGSRAVRQNQTLCPRKSRAVQEASNRYTLARRVDEFFKVLHSHSAY